MIARGEHDADEQKLVVQQVTLQIGMFVKGRILPEAVPDPETKGDRHQLPKQSERANSNGSMIDHDDNYSSCRARIHPSPGNGSLE